MVKQKNEAFNINWTCKKCLNENFPERVECNRCGAAQDVEAKCSSEQGERNKTEIDKKIRKKKSAAKVTDKDQKQWPKQAPDLKIKENATLVETYEEILRQQRKGKPLTVHLKDEDIERAKLLIMRKERRKKKKESIRDLRLQVNERRKKRKLSKSVKDENNKS